MLTRSRYPFLSAVKVGFGAASKLNEDRWEGRAWVSNSRLVRTKKEDALPPVFLTGENSETPNLSAEGEKICLVSGVPKLYGGTMRTLWMGAARIHRADVLESILDRCCFRHGRSPEAEDCAAALMNSRDIGGSTALLAAEERSEAEMAAVLRRLICTLSSETHRIALLSAGEPGLEVGDQLAVSIAVASSSSGRIIESVADEVKASVERVKHACGARPSELDVSHDRAMELIWVFVETMDSYILGDRADGDDGFRDTYLETLMRILTM